MTTFTKITADNLDSISGLDVRAEAAAAIAAGKPVWHRAVPGAIGSVTVFPESGRAAVRHNADAQWGDYTAVIADDGSADASFHVSLDGDERHLYNADAVEVCCYSGCTERATTTDSDGDACCERCYWQAEAEFVELHVPEAY